MNSFFLVFIGLPAMEIFFMIKIGGQIGAFNTIMLIFLTAVIGIFYARVEGIKTIRSGLINLYQNKTPIYEILSGASIAIAAILLMIPGFMTDIIGFLLLVPITRKIFLKIIFKNNKNEKIYDNKNKTIDGEILDKEKKE
tara:strand:+ start:33 stop:452 length:420 start_codon:yes stop_codon:yes gene_type:complete